MWLRASPLIRLNAEFPRIFFARGCNNIGGLLVAHEIQEKVDNHPSSAVHPMDPDCYVPVEI